VAGIRAGFARGREVIVDNEADASAPGEGQDGLGHAKDLLGGGELGTELNQVGATFAQLPRQLFGGAPAQPGCIDKGIKPAV